MGQRTRSLGFGCKNTPAKDAGGRRPGQQSTERCGGLLWGTGAQMVPLSLLLCVFENFHKKKAFKICFPKHCVSCGRSLTWALLLNVMVMLCGVFVRSLWTLRRCHWALGRRPSRLLRRKVTPAGPHRVHTFMFLHENKVDDSCLYCVVARMMLCWISIVWHRNRPDSSRRGNWGARKTNYLCGFRYRQGWDWSVFSYQ